jgi:ABC-type Mn2+/Zn2+ transport system permease subunit
MFWWAAGLGAAAAVGGILLSLVLDTATGATIILLGAFFFGVSVFITSVSKKH